ncbi:hypothetical protein Y1Q_0007990 [Alligator mississippiensis]|uniref:Uncharacterized protein n=1 Tax=Alligator mississippiensis TaxID=8496 RepID=A0A151NF83_ALLMI|nr:hypothetical protein Y1Q_0007990 [Alligator mississippiensis]
MEGGRGGGRGTRITTTKFDLPGAASPILAGELPPGQGERWLRAHPARHPRGEREQCFGGEDADREKEVELGKCTSLLVGARYCKVLWHLNCWNCNQREHYH